MKKLFKFFYILICASLILSACDKIEALEKPLVGSTATESKTDIESKSDIESNAKEPEKTPEPTPEAVPSPSPEASKAPEPEPSPEPSPEPPVEIPPVEALPTEAPPIEAPPVMPETIVRRQVEIPEVSGYPAHNFGSPYTDSGALSNKKSGWYFNRNKEHVPPTATRDFDIRQFDGHYLGDTGSKVVYLTFDEGYENGYTEKILDVLAEKQVHAAFFVTKPYITSCPDLIQRMVDEGHIVGNHSVTHKSFPDLSDEDIIWELEETARAFYEVTGQDMPLFFRPPMGEYSARTLAVTMNTGYKSIFWSFAYKDWETDNQPGKAAAYETVMNDLHNGQIMLLHAVSSSNTEALPDIIDSFKEHGYEFLSLYDLP